MSGHPYHILEILLAHARRFSGCESLLNDRPPIGPFSYFQPVFEIKKGLATHGY
jgi:hypothetical protein